MLHPNTRGFTWNFQRYTASISWLIPRGPSWGQTQKTGKEAEVMSVAQSCLTLCNPMDYSPARLLCPWGSPGKNTGVGCPSLLQEVFPTQGSNPGLSHCRQILYCLSHQGSPPPKETCVEVYSMGAPQGNLTGCVLTIMDTQDLTSTHTCSGMAHAWCPSLPAAGPTLWAFC